MSDPADTSRLRGRIHERLAALTGRPRNWLFFSLIIGSYPLIHVATHTLPDPIPIYDQVEPFELVDHRGEKIGLWRENSPREIAIETCKKVTEAVPGDHRSPDLICEHPTRPEGIDAICTACIDARDRGRLHVNLTGKIWIATVVCADCDAFDETTRKAIYTIQHHSRSMGKHFKIVSFTSQPEKDDPEALRALGHSLKASKGMWSFVTGDPAVLRKAVDNIFNRKSATRRVNLPSSDNHNQVAIVDPGGYIRGYYDLRDPGAVKMCLRDLGLVGNRGF
jgi:cytochrome oxidase Cu insertion factor (SCO1/SenC/PrrC family)